MVLLFKKCIHKNLLRKREKSLLENGPFVQNKHPKSLFNKVKRLAMGDVLFRDPDPSVTVFLQSGAHSTSPAGFCSP